jgi:hypothetical protein
MNYCSFAHSALACFGIRNLIFRLRGVDICVMLTVVVCTHFASLLKRYLEQIAMHTGAGEGKNVASLPRQTKTVLQFMGRPAMVCFSVLPSKYSMAMNALPFSSPMS